MQRKVQAISRKLAESLSVWAGVETVVLSETANAEIFDPYFTIQLDVYHRGELPGKTERRQCFGNPAAFETVAGVLQPQDRFLLQELPVQVRFQEIARFDELLQRIDDRLWLFHDTGTNLFYRLAHGQPLYQRTPWLQEAQRRLRQLPDHFWKLIQDGWRSSMTYAFSDLQAAALRADPLLYLLSLAQFLRSLCSFLFALNCRFEPSLWMIARQVIKLSRLPDGFAGRFESLLREDPELPPERKREIAELLARSVLAMV